MNPYVEASQQLIVELYTSDIRKSLRFYRSFGFELVREESDFMELKWEDSRLFLALGRAGSAPPDFPLGNIRVMVPNVDEYWALLRTTGARVIAAIGDRSYGLRDFTVAGPDGIGLRFATRLSDSATA